MGKLEDIQKLRVRTAYLWGLGIGIVVTAIQLTPKISQGGDKYMITTVFGLVVLVAAGVLTWYVRRREIAESQKGNPQNMTEKK